MTTELTVRDFLLHYIKKEYIKRADIIIGLTSHVEKLHCEYLLSNIERSKFIYYPYRELCIDESMIRYYGSHSLRRFMPKKPIRDGFKPYILCEAKSYYVLSWCLDTSKIAK